MDSSDEEQGYGYDSEDDMINNDMEVEADNLNDQNLFENHPHENVAEVDEEDFATDSEHGSSIVSDSSENDDAVPIIGNDHEAFHLNFERAGLDVPLVAAGNGRMMAWERFILSLAKSLSNRETYKSMIENFELDNMAFDSQNGIFPKNMRDFWRTVNRREQDFRHRVFCTVCGNILGDAKEPTHQCECGQCGPGQVNSELGTCLYISLHSQINQLFRRPGIAADLEYPYTRIKSNINAIEDVYDGSEYIRHCTEGTRFLRRGNHNYSFAMWVDGVNPVASRNMHIYPVFFQILELSPRARQRHAMLAAVYVGPKKPPMGEFLTPVVAELRELHITGVSWRPTPNQEITSRFMVLILSADSEERYRILGMTRHNGRDGCTYCNVTGRPNNEAANNNLIYSIEFEGNVVDRTDEEMRRDALAAAENEGRGRVNGFESVSPLFAIDVDLRRMQLIEGLHLFWNGNHFRLISNLTNPLRANHINAENIAVISDRIVKIRTPTKLSRKPRPLHEFKQYTATGYRNNTWHYWLQCAHEFMTPQQVRMFAVFAEATFILNKDSILPAELDRAEELLIEYRQSFEDHFPQSEWVYNQHLLKHAVRSVRELGPAWVASGFWFESLNRQVVNFVTSPNDRAAQVACRMLLSQMIEKYLDEELRPEVLLKLRGYIGRERWSTRPQVAVGAFIRIPDHGRNVQLEEEEIAALREAGFHNIECALRVNKHKKTDINGIIYQVPNRRVTRYNNSIVHVNAPHCNQQVDFIEIRSIVTWQDNLVQRQGMFGLGFLTTGQAFDTTFIYIVEETDRLVYIPQENVIIPGVLAQPVADQPPIYISRMSNRWDND